MQTDDWRPTACPDALRERSALLGRIRSFFSERDVIEVETPLLSRYGNPDPAIDSVRCPNGWLRTSPEFALKRLLAAGCGDCYELGRVFRDSESGRRHNPEFTLLEWYRIAWDWPALAKETIDLICFCGNGTFDGWSTSRVSYGELFQQHLGIDPHRCSVDEACRAAARAGVDGPDDLSRREWLDLLFASVIESRLPERGFTIVHDFPADQAALARIRADDPPVAERFEVFLGQVELANGYQELADPTEQRHRFQADNDSRRAQGRDPVEPDERFLAALDQGLPDCAGVALGVDRLLMAITGAAHIDEVVAFPFDRA